MAATRSCCRNGTFCTLCCLTHGVPEIDKAPFTTCRHCVEGMGCAAHGLPPGACSEFRCAYLRGLSDDDTWPHRCGFVQEYRWTRYGHTWILSATAAAKLDTPIARREMVRALKRDLVIVLEKPGWTILMVADNRDRLEIDSRGRAQHFSVMRAAEYLGFPVSAKSHAHDDLGVLAWHQL